MYQFNMSVDKLHADWFSSIEKVLTIQLKELDGVVASKASDKRVEISLACENANRQQAKKTIKNIIKEMYLTVVKYEYLKNALKMPHLSCNSFSVLLHTLVAFDKEAECEIIDKNLKIADYLALDGFFNFRLTELKKRWDEIAELASNNARHLHQEETLNELLKFLMSAITPKIKKLYISVLSDHFNVSGQYKNSSFEFRIINPEQLMIYLINVAPIELILEGEFSDKKLYNRIVSIFDGKATV